VSVRVVCDSTSDLDPAFREAHGIAVVPLKVIFGDEVFEDSVDLTPDQFYARMRTSTAHPRTSQPAPGEFEAVFRAATATGDAVVCTTISADLSGTYAAAQTAQAALPDRDIRLVDTRTVGPGHNELVRLAVEMAERGSDPAEVVRSLDSALATMRTVFTVDSLEFLRRGGRIGGGQAVVGSMLSIKPILEIRDGKVEATDRVRTFARALDRIVEDCVRAATHWGGAAITVAHAASPGVAADLARRLQPHAVAPIVLAPVGPVIGCHSGPGAVGFSYYRPSATNSTAA
jgi:DegV family protein with EDD domain